MTRRAEHDSARIRTGITYVQQNNTTGGISERTSQNNDQNRTWQNQAGGKFYNEGNSDSKVK